PPVLYLVPAVGPGHELLGGCPLGAEPAPGDGAVGVALDLDDPLVLDEHLLPAAARAIGGDRAGAPVGVGGPWRQGGRSGRLGCLAQPQQVALLDLPDDRPGSQPLRKAHGTLLAALRRPALR